LGFPNWPVIYRSINSNQVIFWRRCRGLKKKKLPHQLHVPTSTWRQHIFWRHCRGKRRLLQGEFRTHILYFVLSFAFTLFLLALFYQKHKKLVSFIVVFYV
jgi:hypothetical protein